MLPAHLENLGKEWNFQIKIQPSKKSLEPNLEVLESKKMIFCYHLVVSLPHATLTRLCKANVKASKICHYLRPMQLVIPLKNLRLFLSSNI